MQNKNEHITLHREIIQGTDEWLAARCGLLTASEIKLILTPTLKIAANEKERTHLYELLAQRVTQYVEPHYVSDDMLRGHEDEVRARAKYSELYAPVSTEVGFITNSRWGFTLGYSPDGMVGDDGLIECKSRRQKYQVQTIVENIGGGTIPDDYLLQVQTGLLVSERKWLDFVSYCGGLPMCVVRVYPDAKVQDAIIQAASAFEERLSKRRSELESLMSTNPKLTPTERVVAQEMFV